MTIKGLTYMPTGATVAAATTSLPETPGGERNWDYRYSWMRDSTFTLQALHWLNLDWEAEEFMQFVADLEPVADGGMQIMYGIDGRRDLTESTRDDLSGYAGARPVRIGNGAFDQRQNDVYGAVLDCILQHTEHSQRLSRRLWPIVENQAECAMRVWREPDQGIWEARGAPRQYVSSKLMCWVAMDRAAKLAAIRGDNEKEHRWREVAEEIRADILQHGVSDQKVLRQHYDTESLDASVLLAAVFGFLAPEDPVLRTSVLAIADELTENGYVLRYRTEETDDGLSGKEGTFLICSFWLVSALAIIGELQRARDLMERLLRDASPLGLYAEELDAVTGRHLGNFPQAFSHLALIEAAARIIVAERLEELSLMTHYDVIVIGSGAGGGTLVHRLAPSGKKVLLLERGDWLPREPQNWSAADVFVDGRYTSADTWYDEHGKPFAPQVHYYVGGATKLYGAALYRLREEDFGMLEHDDGASPAWPVGYDEFEPYYTQAERLYQVHGARGEDPTEPPASAPYPFPAVSHEPRIQQLSDDLAAAGLHPFHAPCGVLLDEQDPQNSRCIRCATCDGFPCLVHAKSDAEVLAVRPALEHDNVTLLTNTRVLQLETNAAGTAITGVVTEDGRDVHGRHRRRLLRRDQLGRAAAGLGQRRAPARDRQRLRPARAQLHVPQQPGRARAVEGREPDRVPEDARDQRLLLRLGRVPVPAGEHPDGRQVVRGHVPGREAAADEARSELGAARRRAPRDRLLAVHGGSAAAREPGHAAPRREHPARLPADQPGPEAAAAARAQERCWGGSGSRSTTCCRTTRTCATTSRSRAWRTRPGTCRFGRFPETSVLNTDCRAHEVDNLYVVDTSFFPSIGAVNPALTAMANALRVGDHLLGRLGVATAREAAAHV